MNHVHTTLIVLLTILSTACGGRVDGLDHEQATTAAEQAATTEPSDPSMGGSTSSSACLITDEYRFAYSAELGEMITAAPGDEFCPSGQRDQWCIYHGSERSDGTNLIGSDAVADSGNADSCAPGFEDMGGSL